MPDITYNRENFDSLCSKVDESIKAIEKEYKLLKECMDDLNACWEGPNYYEFMTQFAEDERHLHKIIFMLKSYKKMLVSVKQEYSKCEDDVMSIVASCRSVSSIPGSYGGGFR